jgi:hypothetical protein
VIVIDDHHGWWQSIDRLGGEYSIGAAVESASPLKPFPGQPPVQFAGAR